eukprot:1461071-Amphidinium_carterae.1
MYCSPTGADIGNLSMLKTPYSNRSTIGHLDAVAVLVTPPPVTLEVLTWCSTNTATACNTASRDSTLLTMSCRTELHLCSSQTSLGESILYSQRSSLTHSPLNTSSIGHDL